MRDSLNVAAPCRVEKRIADLEELRDDIQAFADKIDQITKLGYTPHIDDGVLINMAPLWELIPSWQAKPKEMLAGTRARRLRLFDAPPIGN